MSHQIPSRCRVCGTLTPEETLRPKVAALPQADGGMLSMPLEDLSPLLPASRQARAGGERQP